MMIFFYFFFISPQLRRKHLGGCTVNASFIVLKQNKKNPIIIKMTEAYETSRQTVIAG